MKTSARRRRIPGSHDVVGAAGRLALSALAVTAFLLGTVAVAPTTVPAVLISMLTVLAAVFGVAAGTGAVAWAMARYELRVAADELTEEIARFLASVPPTARH
ncbi:hypothetical protein [Georgenia yuyongxinii]